MLLKYFDEYFILAQISQIPTFSLHHSLSHSVSYPALLLLTAKCLECPPCHQVSFKDYPYSLKCPFSPLSPFKTLGINFSSVSLHCRSCFYSLCFQNNFFILFDIRLFASIFPSRLCLILIIVSQQHITQETAQRCKQLLVKFIFQLFYQTNFQKIVKVSIAHMNKIKTQLRKIQ